MKPAVSRRAGVTAQRPRQFTRPARALSGRVRAPRPAYLPKRRERKERLGASDRGGTSMSMICQPTALSTVVSP